MRAKHFIIESMGEIYPRLQDARRHIETLNEKDRFLYHNEVIEGIDYRGEVVSSHHIWIAGSRIIIRRK